MELTQLVLEGQKILAVATLVDGSIEATRGMEVKAKPVGTPHVISHLNTGTLNREVERLASLGEADAYSLGRCKFFGPRQYTPAQLYKILR